MGLWQFGGNDKIKYMKKELLKERLVAIDLSENQALVYLSLLEHGLTKAGRIPDYTGLKRSLCYKILDQLLELGFIEKHGESAVAFYSPLSPMKLRALLDKKVSETQKLQEDFSEIEGMLKSQFNLLSGKPSVQYFEGEREVEKMLNDSLETQNTMYTYVDVSAVDTYFSELNNKHVQKRKDLQIHKKILVVNNKQGIHVYKQAKKDSLTEVRVIQKKDIPFGAVAEIYDNKVSYITASNIGLSGVLIEDKQIAQMNKFIFESLWESCEE